MWLVRRIERGARGGVEVAGDRTILPPMSVEGMMESVGDVVESMNHVTYLDVQ